MKIDGTLDYSMTPSPWTQDGIKLEKCLKTAKKEIKKLAIKHELEKRSLGNGNAVLQGLYDSISHGKARAKGVVMYGHSLQYFSKGHGRAASELLSEFVTASIMNPELVDIFAEDYPKTAKALRKTMINITENLGG